MSEQQLSIVRQSVRYDVLIRAAICILPEHARQVRFAESSGVHDGWVDVDLVDFSSSGVGLMSPVFVPRRSLILVRLFGYGPEAPIIVEAPVRIQRVSMTDRRPGYLIGTSFADPPPSSIEQINSLLELLAGPEGA